MFVVRPETRSTTSPTSPSTPGRDGGVWNVRTSRVFCFCAYSSYIPCPRFVVRSSGPSLFRVNRQPYLVPSEVPPLCRPRTSYPSVIRVPPVRSVPLVGSVSRTPLPPVLYLPIERPTSSQYILWQSPLQSFRVVVLRHLPVVSQTEIP